MDKTRSEVDDKYKWNLSDIYTNWDEWDKDFNLCLELVNDTDKYFVNFMDSANKLYELLKYLDKVNVLTAKLDFYTFLKIDEDLKNNVSQEKVTQIEDLLSIYSKKSSSFEPTILKYEYNKIEEFINSFPKLEEYRFLFEQIFRKKEYILSDAEEKLLTSFSFIERDFAKASSYLRDSELEFNKIKDEDNNEVQLYASNLLKYSRSNDRNVRKDTFESISKAYNGKINTLSTNYSAHIKFDELDSNLRGFSSSLEKHLFDLNLNREVYDNLIKAAKSNISIYQKYLGLLKDVLKVDKLEQYDLRAPLITETDTNISVEDAKKMIIKAFSFYGEYYEEILNKAFDQKWIDFLPNINKSTGWYAAYVPECMPKVKANFQNKISDVSALSHELGHLVNQYFQVTCNKPSYVYSSHLNAEVASLTNEIVLTKKMQRESDDKALKLQMLGNFIETFANNFFGSLMGAIFEDEAHKLINSGVPVTSEKLNNIWNSICMEFYGDKVNIRENYQWSRIPHFFNSYYYFTYATGISSATSLASRLLSENKEDLDSFKEYLTIGGSKYPLDALKVAKIDLTDEKTYLNAINMFDEILDEFITLYNS